ncbi:MAG: hypothetical protein JEZ08_20725 [Clostridiales bacterium]|nr:hypothetical protein [Clostridiales bacterium]
MRNKLLIAEHRGGLLSKENHQKLVKWGRQCSEHVFTLLDGPIDQRILDAIESAKNWEEGNIKTGEAMKASVSAHECARETSNSVVNAVARSAGHAVATAHMADHSIGAALYALKAVKAAGRSIEEEKKWQTEELLRLPSEIVEPIQETMKVKEKSFKI